MIFNIACVGKIKEKHFTDMIKNIQENMPSGHKLIISQVPDKPIPKKSSDKTDNKIKEEEGNSLLKVIDDKDFVIALCIEGKDTGSKQLKELIDKAIMQEYNRITFVIGGSLGLSESVTDKANYKLSFSKMTFPHQLMRVMLADQIRMVL